MIRLFAAVAAFFLLTPISAPTPAHDDHVHLVKVTKAWSRPTGQRTMSGVIYLTITNTGKEADTLTGIHSPAAEMTMLHETVRRGEMASMNHIEELVIPAGKTVTFEPGGHHIMLMRLEKPIASGDLVPVTLTFSKSGKMLVLAKAGMMAPIE